MSEFYRLRRTKITDGFALFGFLVGFFAPAYPAALRLANGIDAGYAGDAIFWFIVTLLSAAVLGGIVGLIIGFVVARIWEMTHKVVRKPEEESAAAARREDLAWGTSRAAQAAARPPVQRRESARPGPSIRFSHEGVTAADFVSLAARATGSADYDSSRISEALGNTTNIGAWEDDELVGVIRVLSDGYLFATVPEILVDPAHRRHGIGRTLMNLALDASPTGIVFFGSPPDSVGFFERLGCQRAPSGYVLRRKVAPSITSK